MEMGSNATATPPGGKGDGKKARRRGPKHAKPKMTKEERRAKYTALARDRRRSHLTRKRDKHLTCYRCHRKGHSAENCTAVVGDGGGGGGGGGGTTAASPPRRKAGGGGICYKCGSVEHRLQACPKVRPFLRPGRRLDFGKLGDLPYAECYVCNRSGHLASHCPESSRGVYPQGGACRVCGSVHHYAADCPEKNDRDRSGVDGGDDEGSIESSNSATIDQYLEEPAAEEMPKKSIQKKKKRVVNF